MSKNINLPLDLPQRLGDKYAGIAHSVSLFNNETDHNMRLHYLGQLRNQARRVADESVERLKFSNLTTDQKVSVISDHRAAGHAVLALCDAVEL